jgi:hypothetical protein
MLAYQDPDANTLHTNPEIMRPATNPIDDLIDWIYLIGDFYGIDASVSVVAIRPDSYNAIFGHLFIILLCQQA